MPICLFYLVLRGLDTIEDDMTIDLAKKEPLLREFADLMEIDGWTFTENGPNEKDRELLVHFDDVIAELKKVKGKYDSACQEVENKRKKTDSSFDMNKQKAQAAYQQQLPDMQNAKNTYLVSINVANKQKERYYNGYVPELLDVRPNIPTPSLKS